MYFKRGNMTINTEGLRCVTETRPSPIGGFPYHESGMLEYEDGTTIKVSLEFAEALSKKLLDAS